MSKYIIEGGHRLNGNIKPQGAKNEALQVISAVLLTSEPVTIHNVPNILDVKNLIDLLRAMNVKVEKIGEHSYRFQADDLDEDYISSADCCCQPFCFFVNLCSVLVVGPLLARLGQSYFAKPGGDKIGRRKVDTHISGLSKLGAMIAYNEERQAYYLVTVNGLKGCYILLDEASVTGTANIIMAASLAEGTTTIYNAACEPYVQQLCRMLSQMGVKIEGIGSNLLRITGTDHIGGADHTILPDMIEVGSFIGMAALTQSELTIKDVSYDNLGIIPDSFRRLGIRLERRGDDIFIPAQDVYEIETNLDGSIPTIADAPWPGLTPDLLSVMLVTATQCRGSVLIHQKMFESRLFFVDRLIDMGAQIMLCDPHRAVVIGLDHKMPLRANNMHSPDIRAGIAMLIAALSAKGMSTIDNIDQIDRGYEAIDTRLSSAGACISRRE